MMQPLGAGEHLAGLRPHPVAHAITLHLFTLLVLTRWSTSRHNTTIANSLSAPCRLQIFALIPRHDE
jgi:hypothetical protein